MITVGNLTSYKAEPNAANPTTFVWDFDNRLKSATVPAGAGVEGTHSYTYDAMGRRVSKSVNDATANAGAGQTTQTVFACSGQQVLCEYTVSATNTIDVTAPEQRYVYASYVDEPILISRKALASGSGSGSYESYFYTRNQQYSITALTDSSGEVVERYAYTDHGKTTLFDGTGSAITASAYANPYTYTGRRSDPETGLLYFRARMYSPYLGRFISRDPLGFVDGWSRYCGYFGLAGVDPWGLFGDPPNATLNLPSTSRGKWLGEIGNSGFAFTDPKLPIIYYTDNVPDLSQYVYQNKCGQAASVMIDYSSAASKSTRRAQDFSAADKAFRDAIGDPKWKRPAGYTWHHQWVDVKRGRGQMVLVKSGVHRAATHTGAFAIWGRAMRAKGNSKVLKKLASVANKLGVVGKKVGDPVCVLFLVNVARNGYANDGVGGAAKAVGRDIVMADQVEWLVLQSIKPCGHWAQKRMEEGDRHRRCMRKSCIEIGIDPANAPINRWDW